MHRRFITAIVGALLFLGVAVPSMAATAPTPAPAPAAVPTPVFRDLPTWHWAYGSVMKLYEAGIVAADPQGLFRPEQPAKRSEVFKMVLAARRKDVGSECAAMFRDVPCTAWFAPVSETAFRLGIDDGTGTDLFSPELTMTREQLITVVVRALGWRWEAATQGWQSTEERLKALADERSIADWARPAVALALANGVTAGYADGTFRPGGLATRAEAAALASRIVLPLDGLQTVKVEGRTLPFKQALELTASMYATGEPGVGTQTYTGLFVRAGTVAVDPRVIPLGSLLYVEGYGFAIAADIGGAIKGNRIDLFTHSYPQAVAFGLQTRKVWVLP